VASRFLHAATTPAIGTEPPHGSRFSAIALLPASGCEPMANARRF